MGNGVEGRIRGDGAVTEGSRGSWDMNRKKHRRRGGLGSRADGRCPGGCDGCQKGEHIQLRGVDNMLKRLTLTRRASKTLMPENGCSHNIQESAMVSARM
jgi:hypothetical protein